MTKLTSQTARDMAPGETLRCHVVKGLELRARGSVKSWHVYYRSPQNGDRRRPKIGTWPTLSLEAARAAARELLSSVAAGHDPSAARQAGRAAPTVADLASWYLDNYSRPHKAKRSVEEDERNIRNHVIPIFGDIRVAELTSADAAKGLARIALKGPVAANRVRTMLHAMFGHAERDALKWRPRGTNPITDDVPVRPEFSRRRYVRPEEFGKLAAAMKEEARARPVPVIALYCILYAGSRVTELITSKWSDVDGDAIVLKGHKGERTGEVRTIRLPSQAWALLRTLPKCPHGFIFGKGLSRHYVFGVWERIRNRAGCTDVQVRDLRRTFASIARSKGVGLHQIGEIFDHADSSTTEIYAHLYGDTAQEIVQTVADGIDERLALPKPQNT